MRILLVVIAIGCVSLAYAACDAFTTCSSCTQDRGCGWCVTKGNVSCLSGNAAGPLILGASCSTWQYSTSQIVLSVAGFPVNPSIVDVFLYPNEPVQLTVQVTPLQSSQQKLDLFVVQDASSSMDDDLQTFRTLVPSLVNNILAYRDDSYFGMTSFIEKPMAPLGVTDTYSNGAPKNYVYKLHQSLTSDYNKLLLAVNSTTTTGNRDWCECSLDGMGYTILDPNAGWRNDSQKVMVLATDACFHQQGDTMRKSAWQPTNCAAPYAECCFDNPGIYPNGSCPYYLPPNNLDMVFDIYNISRPGLNLPGSGEDYFSVQQLKNLLQQNNIIPIFAITDTLASPQLEYQLFTDLKNFLGFGGIYPLASDSSNLVDAIVSSLDVLSRTVTMSVATDEHGYVTSFSPTTYTNVDVTKVQNFQVNLLANSTVHPNTIQLTVIGFGTVLINILPALPCKGCDGIANSNTYVDACGVCNGTLACSDCAGVPFGAKVPDICGVCGGDGTACRGCDNVPWSNLTIDVCGVCGGDNKTCVGCDGPREIPKVFDQCGICGGNDSCLDCLNMPWGNSTMDACGVCNGKNACIGCDGNYTVPPLAVDLCGICGGHDDCYDCFGKLNGTAKLDNCGVCNGTDACRSCDGTYNPRFKLVNDSCGVCGGDGKSCAGCDGIPNSGLILDLCGICGGRNSCLGCDGVPNSGKTIQCGVCGGNTSCVGCDDKEFSGKVWDSCSVCGGNNTCVGCDGVAYSGKSRDACGVCGGDGTSCIGCDGVLNSNKIVDNCGVCGGTNACLGCDEIPNSGLVFDRCNVCGGNSSCVGCDGVANSGLQFDNCQVCPNVFNYTKNACAGCDGVANSGLEWDACHVCNGSNACVGCDGIPRSNLTLDDCGVCPNVFNYTKNGCFGCDSVPNSGLILDLCNVCGGNNTCVGCDGIPHSGATLDRCGICHGNNSCVGCDDKPNSRNLTDICGVCGGKGSSCLSGCDHLPFSQSVVDSCGVCNGTNSTCSTEAWYLNPTSITIAAGSVGGVILGIAALIAGLFIYKRLTAGAYWYIPKDLLDTSSSFVVENPLFEASGTGFNENPLFQD